MRIVSWQTILMKYLALFFSKIGKDVKIFLSAAVVIGILRVKSTTRSMSLTHKAPSIICN